jgi:hypothetical protein
VAVRALAVLLLTFASALVAVAVYDISIESALVLAPVFVISLGLVAGLVVVWFKAARDSLRRRG